jgi:hypothetical protein
MQNARIARLIVYAFCWCFIGWTNYHYELGTETAKYPYMEHSHFAIGMAVGGPLAWPAVHMGPVVWLDKPYTCQQRWEAFQEFAPELGMKYFRHNQYDCLNAELKESK